MMFRPGDVILESEPYVAVLTGGCEDNHCHGCFSRITQPSGKYRDAAALDRCYLVRQSDEPLRGCNIESDLLMLRLQEVSLRVPYHVSYW